MQQRRFLRHPGEGRGPEPRAQGVNSWAPAFADGGVVGA
jgi:hypothetical protein